MAPHAPQQSESGIELSRMMVVSSDTPPGERQPQSRKHLAYRDAANAATENITLYAQLKIFCKTRSRNNR